MNPNVEKFEIKQIAKEELSIFTSMIEMFNSVFEEDHPAIGSQTSLLKLLSNDHFIAIAALIGNEVAGGLTAYKLPMYYSDSSEIFLYDLAVKPQYQRKGIGKGLLQCLKEYCIKNEIKEFFVMAHEEDEHAIEFYRSTGGRSEKVVNFLYEAEEDQA